VYDVSENRWDEVSIDHIILPDLNDMRKDSLETAGFLGNYTLDKETICYRTQVAIRALILPPQKWQNFANGIDSGEKDQVNVNGRLAIMLDGFRHEAWATIQRLRALGVVEGGEGAQRDVLERRWRQIIEMVDCAIARLQCRP